MMEFVLLTLCITVAILLASGLSIFIMMNPKVMKWYMKKVTKISEKLFEETFKDEDL